MFSILADASADQASAQIVAMMSAMMGTVLLIALAFIAVTVWLFWRIFVKAGFNGALGLLCLIPSVGFLICILILAFGEWPNQRASAPVGSMPMT
ncbi:MAG TPA: hypothetical protein VNF68_15045, partial [Candidatus Baltobacteraceae bacterium]|nr:hypothetical protein [Candidatus Baltobacteraceae bacterium]